MLESCQVLVTGNVHFVLLKRNQCPLVLSVARKAAGATGLGKGDLHRAVIAGITELQKPSGENLSLLKITLMFYFFGVQHSVLLFVSPVHEM